MLGVVAQQLFLTGLAVFALGESVIYLERILDKVLIQFICAVSADSL